MREAPHDLGVPRPHSGHGYDHPVQPHHDIQLRERRYVATQMVRVVCVVLGVTVPVAVPVRLLLFVGAVCLPLFGLVMANAGPTVGRCRRNAMVDGGLTETLAEPELRLAVEPGRVVDGEP